MSTGPRPQVDLARAIIVEAGEPESGAYLLDAANRLCTLLRVHAFSMEHETQRDAVARERAALGDAGFDLAFERGSLAPFDTVVSLADDRLQKLAAVASLDDE
jgi:hypothetical protein